MNSLLQAVTSIKQDFFSYNDALTTAVDKCVNHIPEVKTALLQIDRRIEETLS